MDGRKLAARPKFWYWPKRPTNGAVDSVWRMLINNKMTTHDDRCMLLPYLVERLEKSKEWAYQIDRVPGKGAILVIVPIAQKLEKMNGAQGVPGKG